jgi:hypothetical protein
MADFATAAAKLQSVNEAANVLNSTRSAYGQAKAFVALIDRYTSGSDAAFNAAINALFTAAQRSELAAMAEDLRPIVVNWEANHASALGLA